MLIAVAYAAADLRPPVALEELSSTAGAANALASRDRSAGKMRLAMISSVRKGKFAMEKIAKSLIGALSFAILITKQTENILPPAVGTMLATSAKNAPEKLIMNMGLRVNTAKT